jgi:type II secretory pathway pseudopilin PulG
VTSRASEEDGFGLIELLIAMVVLNVGILAVVAAFSSGALAIRNAATTSNGTAVADRVMEVYRGLRSCGLYLTGGTGNDVAGMPDGIPNSTSTFYSAYHGDTGAYNNVAYFNNGTPAATPLWATDATTGSGYSPIPASSSGCLPSGLPIDPTKAVQRVTGPDGQSYTVFTYAVIVQATGGRYEKQVTVTVLDPRQPTRIIARESSTFDPNQSP